MYGNGRGPSTPGHGRTCIYEMVGVVYHIVMLPFFHFLFYSHNISIACKHIPSNKIKINVSCPIPIINVEGNNDYEYNKNEMKSNMGRESNCHIAG